MKKYSLNATSLLFAISVFIFPLQLQGQSKIKKAYKNAIKHNQVYFEVTKPDISKRDFLRFLDKNPDIICTEYKEGKEEAAFGNIEIPILSAKFTIKTLQNKKTNDFKSLCIKDGFDYQLVKAVRDRWRDSEKNIEMDVGVKISPVFDAEKNERIEFGFWTPIDAKIDVIWLDRETGNTGTCEASEDDFFHYQDQPFTNYFFDFLRHGIANKVLNKENFPIKATFYLADKAVGTYRFNVTAPTITYDEMIRIKNLPKKSDATLYDYIKYLRYFGVNGHLNMKKNKTDIVQINPDSEEVVQKALTLLKSKNNLDAESEKLRSFFYEHCYKQSIASLEWLAESEFAYLHAFRLYHHPYFFIELFRNNYDPKEYTKDLIYKYLKLHFRVLQNKQKLFGWWNREWNLDGVGYEHIARMDDYLAKIDKLEQMYKEELGESFKFHADIAKDHVGSVIKQQAAQNIKDERLLEEYLAERSEHKKSQCLKCIVDSKKTKFPTEKEEGFILRSTVKYKGEIWMESGDLYYWTIEDGKFTVDSGYGYKTFKEMLETFIKQCEFKYCNN